MNSIKDFEKILGYTFRNKHLLMTALTHSSYANECGKLCSNYERLEFLGDSILGMITSEHIFTRFKDLHEGKLTRLRASLVCEKTLKSFAEKLHIGDFLLLSHGEERTGGRQRASILADAFESIIAAVFLDSGLNESKKIVLRFISNELEGTYDLIHDYKTELQEVLQSSSRKELKYNVVGESGPDHDKTFVTEVTIQGVTYGQGTAGSKKEAEQLAAKSALEKIQKDIENGNL